MKEFAERYEKILQYLKTLSGEQEASSALDEISHEYLQLLIKGVHARETKEVLEATRQMAYLKSAMERHLETKDDVYYRFLYRAGVGAGQYKTGEAWLLEQGNADSFERNMTILYGRRHIRDIVETVYANPGIQHKDLAELAGVKANYLTQLAASLTEAGCLYRYGTKKCTYYELTLQGKEYVRKNLPARKEMPEGRRGDRTYYEALEAELETPKAEWETPKERNPKVFPDIPETIKKKEVEKILDFSALAEQRRNKRDSGENKKKDWLEESVLAE